MKLTRTLRVREEARPSRRPPPIPQGPFARPRTPSSFSTSPTASPPCQTSSTTSSIPPPSPIVSPRFSTSSASVIPPPTNPAPSLSSPFPIVSAHFIKEKEVVKRKGLRASSNSMESAFAQFSASMNAVVRFNGLNYQDWSEQVQFYLGLTGLDLSLNTKKPAALTDKSSQEENEYHEQWMRSNRMCLNLMKITMAENMKPMMPKVDIASEFLAKVKELSMSEIADKSIAGNLMT
nr:UBN2 domain-containing protein [Ipomoea batatas]